MQQIVLYKTSILFFIPRGGLSEDDSEEEEEEEAEEEEEDEETSTHKTGQKEEESKDLQLNLDVDEEFKLPTNEQIEKENILYICDIHEPYARSSTEPGHS